MDRSLLVLGTQKEKKIGLHLDSQVVSLKKTREPGGDGIIFMSSTPDCFDDTLSNPHFTVDWGQGSVETVWCASTQRVESTIRLLDSELREVSPVPWSSTRIISLSGFDIHRGFESPLYVTPCNTGRHTHSPTHTNTHTHNEGKPKVDLIDVLSSMNLLSCFMSPYSRNLQ
jgi:hypothetical protein